MDSDAEADAAGGGPVGLSRDVVAALTGVQEEMDDDGGAGAAAAAPADAEGKLGGAQDGTLGVAEEQGVGAVSMATVAWYLTAMGGWVWVVVQLVLLTCERLTYLSTDYFLTTWVRGRYVLPWGSAFCLPASLVWRPAAGRQKFDG